MKERRKEERGAMEGEGEWGAFLKLGKVKDMMWRTKEEGEAAFKQRFVGKKEKDEREGALW